MRPLWPSLLLSLAAWLLPGGALAFQHGDVPNVSRDKRSHEKTTQRFKPEEHEGGMYHRTQDRKASWWNNGGHEDLRKAYVGHHGHEGASRAEGKGARRPKAQKTIELAGGATVSDAPAASGKRGRRH